MQLTRLLRSRSAYTPVSAPSRRPVPLDYSQHPLVADNLPLAYDILNKRFRRFRTDAALWFDLEQAALCGLISAARRYDRSRNARFSTFAYPTIWGTIKNALRSHYRVLDRDGPSHTVTGVADQLLDESDPLSLLLQTEERDHIRRVLLDLDTTDAEVIRCRFGLDGRPELKLRELALHFNVSRERICQRLRRALICLRDHDSLKEIA